MPSHSVVLYDFTTCKAPARLWTDDTFSGERNLLRYQSLLLTDSQVTVAAAVGSMLGGITFDSPSPVKFSMAESNQSLTNLPLVGSTSFTVEGANFVTSSATAKVDFLSSCSSRLTSAPGPSQTHGKPEH